MTVAGRDCVGVGVGALVADSSLRFLLALRGELARNEARHWEFPGGTVEFGERLHATVIREFQEEYGVHIRIFGLLGVFDHILVDESQHWISVTYLARHVSGIPIVREPEKCSQVGWFDLAHLPRPLTRVSAENLDYYCQNAGQRHSFARWVRRPQDE